MASDATTNLTEQQEMLLMRYIDGEASLLQGIRARRLLTRSEAARTFKGQLEHQSLLVQDALEEVNCNDDLWSNVLRGIEAEEQAELWSGARAVEQEPARNSGVGVRDLLWGMSGAVATACVVLILVGVQPGVPGVPGVNGVPASAVAPGQTGGSMQLVSNPTAASVQPGGQAARTSLVSYGPERAAPAQPLQRNFVAQERSPRMPVEVEWLRSDGRIRMISGRNRSVPMMWISRRAPSQPAVVLPGQILEQHRAEVLRAEQLRNEQALDGGKEPIQMLPERIPGAIAISNR